MKISVGMIVRNSSIYLEKCLQSIKNLLDKVCGELIIIDMGSTDETVEIAKLYTDKVFFIKWENDLSKIKNIMLDKANGEWFLFVDSNETLEYPDKIIEFINNSKNYNLASIKLKNIEGNLGNKTKCFSTYMPRMFKRELFRFQGAIHEYVVPVDSDLEVNNCYLDVDFLCYEYTSTDEKLIEYKFLNVAYNCLENKNFEKAYEYALKVSSKECLPLVNDILNNTYYKIKSNYNKNKNILKKKYNINLDNVNLDWEKYKIEKTIEGKLAVRINKEGKKIYLGSKYNYKRDFDNLKKDLNVKYEDEYLILIGFGLGYHILDCFEKYPNNKILVFEEDLSLLKCAAFLLDLTEIFKYDNLFLCGENEKINVISFLEKNIGIYYCKQLKMASFSNYVYIYNREVTIKSTIINNYNNSMIINMNTKKVFSEKVVQSFIENSPYIAAGNSVEDLRYKFKGKPCVIVSAGPSLEKNIKYLRDYQDNVVIITGERTAKMLLKYDIKPHIICAIDSSDIVYELSKEVLDKRIPFALTESTNSNIAKNNKGRNIFTINWFNDASKQIFKKAHVNYLSGGSVAHYCTFLAIYMGCSSIIFIGQDLAYTGNKLHADGAANTSSDLRYGKKLYYVKGNIEPQVLTCDIFDSYRIWFEDYIYAYKNIKFINATEGGAYINGTIVMNFTESLEMYCKNKVDAEKTIERCLQKVKRLDKRQLLDNIKVFLERLNELKTFISNDIESLEKLYDEFDKFGEVNHDLLNNIKILEHKINNFNYGRDLLSYMSCAKINEINMSSDYRVTVDDDDELRTKKQILKNIKIQQDMKDSLENIVELIKKLYLIKE
ncbi:6-hydroxymethylpterin diphosphokinase MptE-like protein [Clostridium beijerinckii]|uniref:6-hydroxymethylpterin diphosphokinase MptE-like protein n=1 Tax=Clostridium beijerinckii TaxID=1520 RepID=UPI001361B074|nr:6-hydroxymethylpterin diphosphokinase MptE-like protein [Clostridium beijerinckii]MZK49888.1 DUF115 domain-containing protein [Clostridium beijerinckii]MZK57847.1 DUF115 domain-containing protein [Clostridium beijerinckii]MZK68058.1 DUF115 domain-containing protein [Clostridium beijerinckii]MZK73556.1 DUF115 domain-containing protein [Clostridium beijerinckii]MZK83138.1 DUF115 domain-containing protein [Clostridium beijerinckii]